MDWIKINTALPRSPKVLRLAALMGIDRSTALGLMIDWLCWLDTATEDGSTGLSAETVNHLFCADLSRCLRDKSHADSVTNVTQKNDKCHAFLHSLGEIGWIVLDENGAIFAAEFEKHNGECAKKRAQNAKRQSKKRSESCHANCVTSVTLLSRSKRDQIREEKSKYNELHPNASINTVCGGDDAADVDATREGVSSNRNLPETADDVLTFLAAQPSCGLRGDELLACAEAFFHEFDSVGWVLRGQPIRNWHSAARSFLAKWQNNLASRSAAAPSRGRITYRSETNQNYEL